MINKKLYKIFSTFSKKDWKDFILYVKSSDIIYGRKFLPLVLEFKKHSLKLGELQKIQPPILFEKAYDKIFSDRTISSRQNELVNILKKFLESIAYKKDELYGINFYFRELLSRNLTDVFSYEYKKKKNTIDKYKYSEESYNVLSKLTLFNTVTLLKQKMSFFESYFYHSKVLFADIISNLYKTGQQIQLYKRYFIKSDYDPILRFIDAIASDEYFDELEKQKETVFIVPLIRYYIFKSQQNLDNEKYISKVKKIYFANENKFSDDFKTNIYQMIMTYYNIKINEGKLKYLNDLFLLYKKKLTQNLVSDLKEQGEYVNIFREYVITGLRVNQYKWVEMVIEKYSPLLPDNIREDEYTLALVRLHFAKKEYETTIRKIHEHKSQNIIHYIDSIKIKLASYYELQKYEECYLEIDNAKHYINTHVIKIPQIYLQNFKVFLNRFLKLLNYRTNPFNKDIYNVLRKIEKSHFSMQDWMLKKFNELLKDK